MRPRIRTIKPEFFKHEDLYDAEQASGLPLRLAFAGLWTCCDREGRFPWRPRMLKTEILPYDACEFGAVLDTLAQHGFIVRYSVNGEQFGCVPSFPKHQAVNNREQPSDIPAPPETREHFSADAFTTREPRDDDASATHERQGEDVCPTALEQEQVEGNGMEGNGTEQIAPDGASPRVRPEEYANTWNELRGPLPKVREFTESRRKKVKTRMAEGVTLQKFAATVRRCATTPFLVGNNDRGWQADFDWLLENDTNLTRVMEGKYDSGNGGNGSGAHRSTKEDRIIAATRGAIAAVANRAIGETGDAETGGSGPEDLGDFRFDSDPVPPEGCLLGA